MRKQNQREKDEIAGKSYIERKTRERKQKQRETETEGGLLLLLRATLLINVDV